MHARGYVTHHKTLPVPSNIRFEVDPSY